MHSIEELRTFFLDYLQQNKFTQTPSELYEPNNYFLQIGGKRLRPALLLLCTEIFGGKYETALDAALATEYFHNFTLIHDDIMDNAPLRRGFPTVHEKYNLTTGIISGDVLMIQAYQCLSNIDKKYFKQVFDIFTKTAIEVCEGQQMDINFELQTNVLHQDYLEMIKLKTAVLVAASMQIGAIIGGANEKDADTIYQYGLNLGIAFQIQDDVLDCFGKPEQVGKQLGGDILQNKKTLLLLEALKIAESRNDNHLENALKIEHSEEKLKKVLAIFNTYQIKEYGTKIRDSYIEQSIAFLNKINIDKEKKAILNNLIQHLVLRSF